MAALDPAWINAGALVVVALIGTAGTYLIKVRARSISEAAAYRRELVEINRELRHEVNRQRKEIVALRREIRQLTARRHA